MGGILGNESSEEERAAGTRAVHDTSSDSTRSPRACYRRLRSCSSILAAASWLFLPVMVGCGGSLPIVFLSPGMCGEGILAESSAAGAGGAAAAGAGIGVTGIDRVSL